MNWTLLIAGVTGLAGLAALAPWGKLAGWFSSSSPTRDDALKAWETLDSYFRANGFLAADEAALDSLWTKLRRKP